MPRNQKARRRLLALAIGALAAFVAGISVGAGGGGEERPGNPAVALDTPVEVSEDLSPEKQVGQLLISRFDGRRAPAYILQRLRAGQTAGVILFGDNVGRGGIRPLTGELQAAARRGALIATDDEGGSIMNVALPTPLPAQPDLSTSVAEATRTAGRELREEGVNVNLAPVADLPVPGSVMSGRAYTGAPHDVAAKTAEAVRGFGQGKVAPAVKHFPGLGPAVQNTDDASVTIEGARKELEDDLLPFRAAIDLKVPLVMASHALYPALDRRRIASQSSAVLEGLLRDGLGYDGVIVTDSIEAQAVLDRSSVEVAAERSIDAGADLVLMTGRGSWIRIYPRLLARFRRDPVFRERVAESVARVLKLKRSLGLSATP